MSETFMDIGKYSSGICSYKFLMCFHCVFCQVSASDKDIGVNAEVRYSLAEPNNHFDISPVSGTVHTKGLLQTKKYQFDIIAEDLGEKPRKTTGELG